MKRNVAATAGLLVLAGVLMMTGCVSMPTREKMTAELEGYTLPRQSEAETGMIYVVRPSSLGTLIRFNVFLDDKEDASEMGYTRGSQYVYFCAAPGPHVIYSKAENWAEIDVDVKAGQTVFVKQIPEMGILMARNSLELLDELEGRYHVKKTSPGTIKKERK